MKIRTMRSKTAMDMIQALGGAPTPIPWGELYTALQRKVVTSMPNSLNAAADIKVWEVCDHFSMIGYVIGTGFLVVNKTSFDKLPADLQEVVTEAGMAYSLYQKEAITNIGNMRAGSVYNQFSNKALHTVADAKGLINRVAQMAPLVRCWQAYGAKPTSMDWGEIYTSLQTGVIDSIDNPILDMYDEKFYEAIKYVNMTKNLYNMISYNTSMAFWSQLTDKEKEVFKKATQVASEKGAAEVKRRLGGVTADLKKRGIEFIETDTSGFKKAVQDNIEEILGGNKDAIEVYWKIIKKQY